MSKTEIVQLTEAGGQFSREIVQLHEAGGRFIGLSAPTRPSVASRLALMESANASRDERPWLLIRTFAQFVAPTYIVEPVTLDWRADLLSEGLCGHSRWDPERRRWVITAQAPVYALVEATTRPGQTPERADPLPELRWDRAPLTVAWEPGMAGATQHLAGPWYCLAGGAKPFVATGAHPNATALPPPLTPWNRAFEYVQESGSLFYNRRLGQFVAVGRDTMPALETLSSLPVFRARNAAPINTPIPRPEDVPAVQEATLRVLFHELAHVVLGHVNQPTTRPATVTAAGTLDASAVAAKVTNLAENEDMLGFMANNELEADRWADAELSRWLA